MTDSKSKLITVSHCKSWKINHGSTHFSITEKGGQLLPQFYFSKNKKPINPYFIAPWSTDKNEYPKAPVLNPLRGDFFCMPFAGSDRPVNGVYYLPHGESSYARWKGPTTHKQSSVQKTDFLLSIKKNKGTILKRITTQQNQTAFLTEHRLNGFQDPMTFGHHPNLLLPQNSSALLSKSPYLFGQVFTQAEKPAQGGYSSLKSGALFEALEKVPLNNGGYADLTQLPFNTGFTEVVTVASDPRFPLAWTTLLFPDEGFLWFSIKKTAVLPTSVIWIQDGGRHYPPWNSIRGIVGLEETCGLVDGLATSLEPNPFSKKGVPTFKKLASNEEYCIEFLQGVTLVPKGFEKVEQVEIQKETLLFIDRKNKKIRMPLGELLTPFISA